MASLLLIGGSGFFGKSFLDSFQRGELDDWSIDRVIVMSRHADRLRIAVPQLLDQRVELVNADIGITDSLPVADYVIHAAASTDARNYLSKPEVERKNIQAGVHNYCRLAPKFHASSKIVYVSSGAVYGVQPADKPFLVENELSINLQDMPEHKRDYAIAKRDAEAEVQDLCNQGLAVSIARCFAFVGPWLPRDHHFAIGNFIEDGLMGRTIQVKATNPVYRSYMHADDLVAWLMTMAKHADINCNVYNVGSDVPVEIRVLAQIVGNEFEGKFTAPDLGNEKIDRYIPSVEKIKKELGLEIKLDLIASLRKTLESINANCTNK